MLFPNIEQQIPPWLWQHRKRIYERSKKQKKIHEKKKSIIFNWTSQLLTQVGKEEKNNKKTGKQPVRLEESSDFSQQ